ncbi:hypothetical protein BD770DRAFT_403865, partial [Pilaira anomala]
IDFFQQGIIDETNPKMMALERKFALVVKAQDSAKAQIESILNQQSKENNRSANDNKQSILTKDVPIFNVLNNNTVKSEELSLTTFLLQFERLFSANSVNIDQHWLYYLEISFEQSPKYYSWFTVNLKNSQKTSWNSAKELLKQRFDLASQASVHSLISSLVTFCYDENESFILCMERFRMLVIKSKVNRTDNVLLVYDKISSILRNVHRIDNPSLASDLKVHHAPVSWSTFEQIISGHVAAIEEILTTMNNQKINSLCTYCKVAKYDFNHGNNCEAKIQFYKNRNSQAKNFVNMITHALLIKTVVFLLLLP